MKGICKLPFSNLTKSAKSFNRLYIRNFSTLIIPDIYEGKVHANNYKTLLKAAEQLSKPTKVLVFGDKIDENTIKSASYFVDEIFVAEHASLANPTSEAISSVVTKLHEQHKFTNIISASNNFGKNFIPRIGGMLSLEPISDVSKIIGDNKFQRFIYAGNALATVESSQKTNLLTIRLTSFDKKEFDKSSDAKVTKISDLGLEGLNTAIHEENIISKSDKPELGSASVVISGGRALKSSDNFKLLDDLAACFKGAAIGASRAAVDAGYVANDLQIGQTGKTVAPDLYIAIGISGAIQHIAGMKDSKVIVAINSDGEAPIFNVRHI
jgi:electron transfer flavoprotein alpha subunit